MTYPGFMSSGRIKPNSPGGRDLFHVGRVFALTLIVVILATGIACREQPSSQVNPAQATSEAPSITLSNVPVAILSNALPAVAKPSVPEVPIPYPNPKLIQFAKAEQAPHALNGKVFLGPSDHEAMVRLSESFDDAISDLASRQLQYYDHIGAGRSVQGRLDRYGPRNGKLPSMLPLLLDPEDVVDDLLTAKRDAALLNLSGELLNASIGEELDELLAGTATVPFDERAITLQLVSSQAALGSMVIRNVSGQNLTDCILISTVTPDVQAVAQALQKPPTVIHQILDEIVENPNIAPTVFSLGLIETLRSAVPTRKRFYVESFPDDAVFIAKGMMPGELLHCVQFSVSLYSSQLYVRAQEAPDLAAAQAAQKRYPTRPSSAATRRTVPPRLPLNRP